MTARFRSMRRMEAKPRPGSTTATELKGTSPPSGVRMRKFSSMSLPGFTMFSVKLTSTASEIGSVDSRHRRRSCSSNRSRSRAAPASSLATASAVASTGAPCGIVTDAEITSASIDGMMRNAGRPGTTRPSVSIMVPTPIDVVR